MSLLLVQSMLVAQPNGFSLPSLFSDNMVVQQKIAWRIWGNASPGTTVSAKTSWGSSATTAAGENGKWMLVLKTPAAGGPHMLTITNRKEKRVIKNVLSGEVWICSGQSNMEMPLGGWLPSDTIIGGAAEIKKANNGSLRFFTVEKQFAIEKKAECNGKWEECTPASAAAFSATGYFFGKKLVETLKIPVGLIHTSWGGTPAQAWTEAGYLGNYPVYKNIVANLPELTRQEHALAEWMHSLKQITISADHDTTKWMHLDFGDLSCKDKLFDDAKWKTMNLPANWENAGLGDFDGAVWFRKTVILPMEYRGRELSLQLGPIDDMDIAYVNGIKAGGMETEGKWRNDRDYPISAEMSRDSEMVIAVRVVDNQGGGGMWGKAESMKLALKENPANSISLAGIWKYYPVAEFRNMTFYYWGIDAEKYASRPQMISQLSANTPTSLYNGMINPLIPLVFKGAIWYQGESNADNPVEYRTLFPDMIKSWRETMQNGSFPFYFTQIAPFDYGTSTNSARLREAQAMAAVSVPNSGMAVTLDIGNPTNIHPGNKHDVGDRLARIALAKTYKKPIACSGPEYISCAVKGSTVVLTFKFNKGLIVVPRKGQNNFTIAGADGIFYAADVKVKNEMLVVSSPKVSVPVAVRYCWNNTDEATLFNSDKLPASSFRTDVEK